MLSSVNGLLLVALFFAAVSVGLGGAASMVGFVLATGALAIWGAALLIALFAPEDR